MGCCGSSDAEKNADQPRPAAQPQGQGPPGQMGAGQHGWGQPGAQVRVAPPDPNDPPFMKTIAPSGTTWSQYVRTGASFVDPQSGYLAGPWAECVSWGVVFEHTNDWASIPEYAADGPVGGILQALEQFLSGNPRKQDYMNAANRLEEASHALADNGQELPAIRQVVTVPQGATPGQMCRVENPQTPGTYMQVQVPQNAQAGQPMLAPAPVQPNKEGNGKKGMSTGAKVGFALGGAALIGGCAYAGAMAGEAGHFDGAIDAMGAEGALDAVGEGAMDVGEFAGEGLGDAGDFLMDLF